MSKNLQLDKDLADALIESTRNLFIKAMNMKVVTEDWSVLESPLRGDYSGTVELFDSDNTSHVAIMSISFMDPVIRFILKTIYGDALNEHNSKTTEMLKDGIGEITNIVYSNVKTILNEKGYKFKMSLPVVIEGKDHIIKRPLNKCLRIPFLVNNYEFYIDAALSIPKVPSE